MEENKEEEYSGNTSDAQSASFRTK